MSGDHNMHQKPRSFVDADDTSQKHVDEMVKTEHNKQIEIAKAYERGWNAALAQQEPVAWMHTTGTGHVYFRKKPQDKVFNPQPVYTSPKRWVGLTEEEREFLLHQALKFYDTNAQLLSFIKTVEEKLKEKNT